MLKLTLIPKGNDLFLKKINSISKLKALQDRSIPKFVCELKKIEFTI